MAIGRFELLEASAIGPITADLEAAAVAAVQPLADAASQSAADAAQSAADALGLDATVNSSGHLIITVGTAAPEDAGLVKGDQGDPGAKGDQGDPGAKGDQGDPGVKGDQGDPGVKGDQGDPGVKGDQGDPGPVGAAGAKGDQGDPGPNQVTTTTTTTLTGALVGDGMNVGALADVTQVDAEAGVGTDIGSWSVIRVWQAIVAKLAAPGAIGGTTPAAGSFTDLLSKSLSLAGNITAAAWTTTGIRHKNVAATLTDTSSTGTVAAAYTNVLGGNTIAASNVVTFTDYATMFLSEPVAGTNVTIANKYSLILAGGLKVGGNAQLNSYNLRQSSLPIVLGVVTVPMTGEYFFVDCTAAITAVNFGAVTSGRVGATKVVFLYNATAGSVPIALPATAATPNKVAQTFATSATLYYVVQAETLPGTALLAITTTPFGVPGT